MLLSFSQVTSRYYWTGVSEDCDETVKRCDVASVLRTNSTSRQPSSIPLQYRTLYGIELALILLEPFPRRPVATSTLSPVPVILASG